jgi:energy-coupling factor transporter ATP-binding protein EcfA2
MLELIRDVFIDNTYFNGDGAPLKAHLTEGDPASKVLLIAGANASGKSFGITVLASCLNGATPKVEPIQVSMKYRTKEGMHRCFMFGPLGDQRDSTGSISLAAVRGGLRTAQGRDRPCWLMLDEPDTGLSEEFTPAMGEYLATAANEGLGEHCQALVVVSHSRALLKEMAATLTLRPHFVHVDEQPLELEGWLASSRRRTVAELEALPSISTERYRAINKILKT